MNSATALAACDGMVVFDKTSRVPQDLTDVISEAKSLGKAHQPLAMDMRWKKSRKSMVRWLRILLHEVKDEKCLLYIDGPAGDDLESLAEAFIGEALTDI